VSVQRYFWILAPIFVGLGNNAGDVPDRLWRSDYDAYKRFWPARDNQGGWCLAQNGGVSIVSFVKADTKSENKSKGQSISPKVPVSVWLPILPLLS